MQQAADDGIMPGGNYEITQPIVITFGKSTQGFMGFNGNGTNGADVITYQIVNPGIDVRYLVLEKFSILDRGGTGRWQCCGFENNGGAGVTFQNFGTCGVARDQPTVSNHI